MGRTENGGSKAQIEKRQGRGAERLDRPAIARKASITVDETATVLEAAATDHLASLREAAGGLGAGRAAAVRGS